MATTRNLSGPTAGVKVPEPQKEKQTITAAEIGTLKVTEVPPATPEESAQIEGETALAITLPSAFSALATGLSGESILAAQDPLSSQGSYVGFAHPQSPSWASQQASEIGEGEIFLGYNSKLIRTMPLKFWLMDIREYRTFLRQDMTPIYATKNLAAIDVPDIAKKANPNGSLDMHYVGLVLVDLGGEIVPAKFDCRGTKEGILAGAVVAVKQAADPAWPQQGDAFRVAASAPAPWMRVYHQGMTHPRTSKRNGRRYDLGTHKSAPVTMDQLTRLAKTLADDRFDRIASLGVKAYNERIEQLDNLCKMFA